MDWGDQPLSRNPATSRSFTVSSGNPLDREWGWEDSNFQPNDYQPLALSIVTSEVPEVR